VSRAAAAIAVPLLLAGCANGDFDRVPPSLVRDNMHAWVGTEAARGAGVAISTYPLTDDETRLRDLAYPLIEPPYDRDRWHRIVGEFGMAHKRDWALCTPLAYYQNLEARGARSQASLYAALKDDIRNDVERIPVFADTARRVIDIDQKRAKSLVYVRELSKSESRNALARNAENALVVAWVQRSLAARAAAYRYALERLVISLPSTEAVSVEQSLALLAQRIAQNAVAAAPPVVGPQPIGPIGPTVPIVSKY
jgi:hypothetical protein